MQTTKHYVQLYENNIETGLEKKKKVIESTPPPPSPEIPRPLTPPTPPEFPIPSVGGYGYFLELHIKEKGTQAVKF